MDDDETKREDLDSTETARVSGDSAAEPGKIPTSIGKYRILSKLGEGGMGVVYEAEQDSPKRKVAVKVVRGCPSRKLHPRRFCRDPWCACRRLSR